MATKVDAAVAKQRQQKIILAVAGVLLVGVLALQGPKLLKHGKKAASSATPAASTDTAGTGATTTSSAAPSTSAPASTTGTAIPPVPTVGTGPAANVAGVVVRSAGAPTAQTGQLWSFSRFKAKDPFVQQVQDKAAQAGAGASTGTGSSKTGAAAPSNTIPSIVGGTVTPTTASPVALAYATLMVNGKAQQLTLRNVFPKGQPTFVLRAVGKKFIRIGVVGGGFIGGAVVKLQLDKPVTFMNTATGQRFVMRLVYTGAQPEQIAGFQAPATPAAAQASTPTQSATAQPATANP